MKCMKCDIKSKKVFVTFRGIKLEALECPICKEQIFTEELAKKAARKLDNKRKYFGHPIKLGRRWGILLPEKLVKSLKLTQKTELEIYPISHGIELKKV